MTQKPKEISITGSMTIPSILLAIMWTVYFFEVVTGISLSHFGILPRNQSGLWGILLSPFLHGGWEHIINNSVPIFLLGSILFYFYNKIAFQILFFSWLIGGAFVWLAARESYHIGMSGVIYSLAFYLFFSGVFRKEVRLMAITLFVALIYGSMVWGIFPIDPKISFEGHLFGAFAGVALAYFYRKEGATFKKKKYQFEIDEENDKKLKSQGYRKVIDENGFTVKYIHKDDYKNY